MTPGGASVTEFRADAWEPKVSVGTLRPEHFREAADPDCLGERVLSPDYHVITDGAVRPVRFVISATLSAISINDFTAFEVEMPKLEESAS